jgi:transcriptional regulator with XRE-family HTH domain
LKRKCMTDHANNSQISGIGARIRTQRRALGQTLQELARVTGLSVGFLSQLERGQTSPSLASLTNIAKALDLPFGALVESPAAAQPDSHQEKRKRYAIENGAVNYERLSTVFEGSRMHAVKIYMPSGYGGEAVSHDGEEFVYVLRGEIEYWIGKKHYRLMSGDSVHFDATIRHRIKASKGDAEVIWVGTLNVYEDEKRARPTQQDKVAAFGGTEFADETLKFDEMPS